MNTYDIELPPMPNPCGIVCSDYNGDPIYSKADLVHYAQAYARAAIEADRKRSGEPVECQDPSMGEHACSNRAQCWEPCGELGKSVDHAKLAEPVKVPSDAIEELAHRMCLKYIHSSDPDMRQYTFGKLTLYEFARALLSRYGQK